MDIELILKDISDKHSRENFTRLNRFLSNQTILNGEWEFYQIEVPGAVTEFKFKHNLKFIPKDIIVLSIDGHKNIDFRYDLFTHQHIVFSTGGAVCLRLLAGSYTKDNRACKLKDLDQVSLTDSISVLPSGSAPRLIAQFNTDVGTVVGDLVRVNGVSTVTKITDNLAATIPNGVFGVAYNKPSATLVDVLFAGIIGGYGGFTTGNPLFVSTGGAPTHTVPTTGMVQQIGFAISATEFFINLMQPMRRS